MDKENSPRECTFCKHQYIYTDQEPCKSCENESNFQDEFIGVEEAEVPFLNEADDE